MATRMQQRRGTAAQWTAANPTLAAGEIGFETDTVKFKVGNGSSAWASLKYFTDAESILGGLSGIDLPATLDTLNELAAAMGDNPAFLTTIATNLTNHATDTTDIHGITNTADLVTTTILSNHNTDTTNVHGITDTLVLATLSGTQTLTNKTFVTPLGITASDVGLGSVNNTTDANKPVSTATQTALDLKANLDSPTFIGTVTLPSGTVTSGMIAEGTIATADIADTAVTAGKIGAEAVTTAKIADEAVTNAKIATGAVTKSMVGLANADNTSDANKPISSATQTALDLKSPLASPTFTGTVTTGHVLPATDITYDLGSPSKMWRDIYVGPGSLYVNGQKVLQTESGDVVLTADANENLVVRTSGDGNIELDPTGSGSVTIKAPLVIQTGNSISNSDGSAVNFSGAIKADTLSSKTANTDLSLSADGTGKVYLNDNAEVSGNLVVGGNLTVSGTTTTVNSETISLADNIIDLNSNFTTGTPTENAGIKIKRGDSADVQIRWNESTDNWEFTNDGTNYSAFVPTASPTFTGVVTIPSGASISGYAPLASPTFTGTVSGVTKSMVGLGSVDNTADADKPVSTATQTALSYKATLHAPTFTGSVTIPAGASISGYAPLSSPTFSGTVSGISATMVGLGNVENTSDANKPVSTATQTALDLKLSSSTAANTYAPLASPIFTGTGITVPAGGVQFTDGTQTKEGVPSRTTIVQKTANYTLSALNERDSLIEVSSATGVTVTIPGNATTAYPIGTSIDILQTGVGQVTIAGVAGVTVNATPGLKLRTQWSSATLMKRATDSWIVVGDLTA